jgi:phosphopantothenoylcysteine decarboxylase/phosphopantothenate--cysteine ligase
MRLGAVVRPVLTEAASRLVSPMLFEWATGLKAVTGMTGGVEHVSLARLCDGVVVAPATLDTLADIASLHASDVVSALVQEALGLGRPVMVVPAMHLGMWRRAERLVERLEDDGVAVLKPQVEGEQAKYPDPWLVAWWVEALLTRGRDLAGLTVFVNAGPTREYIDKVRVITNPSTGLMGVSLALEAAWRGARVRLVHGPLSCCTWSGWRSYLEAVEQVETTEEMLEATLRNIRGVDIALYAAAVADYRPRRRLTGKVPTVSGLLELELEPTPKVAAEAVRVEPKALHVGFTAEPLSGEELVEKAREKLQRYGFDAVAANSTVEPGSGFASETNHVYLLDRWGHVHEARGHKRVVARRILDTARKLYAKKRGG